MANKWLTAARKHEKPRVDVDVLPCESFGLDLAIRNARDRARSEPVGAKSSLKAVEPTGVIVISNPDDLMLIAVGLAKEREKRFKELFKFSQLANCDSSALKEMARFATRLFVDANELIVREVNLNLSANVSVCCTFP